MIVLQENEREYFLVVPYWEKDRAKGIEGYRWDPKKKCWVYPKKQEIYDALIEEFGQELRGLIPKRPKLEKKEGHIEIKNFHQIDEEEIGLDINQLKEHLTEEIKEFLTEEIGVNYIEELREILEEIEEDVEIDVDINNPQPVPDKPLILRAIIILKNISLSLKDYSWEYLLLKKDYETLKNDYDILYKELQFFKSQKPNDILEYMGLLANEVSRDTFFSEIANRMKSSPYEIAELDKKLEERLREIVGGDVNSSYHELIDKARDIDILDRDGYSLALTVRNARNNIIHHNTKPTEIPRCIIALLAGAILWGFLKQG